MIKRGFDILFSFIGLVLTLPLLIIFIFLIYFNDRRIPFYIAPRVGKNEKNFNIIKLRSMIINADKNSINSTSINDPRITTIGKIIRKFKIDELPQLWNVLIGDMSLVGPRPNVKQDTDLYTSEEKKLLLVKPGITDFSSIVFSDEAMILKDKENPNLAYNQLIRPWKSRLGLFYIKHQSTILDLELIINTLIAFISKQKALNWISNKLKKLGADQDLINVSRRRNDLTPHTPPG